MFDLVTVFLLVMPLLVALVCLLPAPSRVAERSSMLSAPLLLVLAVGLAITAGPHGQAAPLGLYVDALSTLLVLVIGVVAAIVILYSRDYMRGEIAAGHFQPGALRWYYFWLQLFVASMLLVVLSGNLGLLWVAMEMTTVLSGVLVGFSRRPDAVEAAWKYVVICSLGIALALFGTVLTYYAAVPVLGRGNSALDWAALQAVAAHLDPRLMRLSFAFILVGFGTKAGLAPMHTWLPDAHSQAPSPVSALLSAALLNCALYAILRYHTLATATLGPTFSSHLLLAFGLLSMAVAIPFLLVQNDVKRLLAYSSVEHIGIVAVAAGLGTRLALFAALLHLLNHALAKCGMFLAAGTLIQRLKTRNITRLGGAVRATPVLAMVLLLGSLALAGSPPFGPFLSEFLAIRAAFGAGLAVIGAVVLVLLTLAFGALLMQIGHIALGPSSHRSNLAAVRSLVPGTFSSGVVLAFPAVAILLLGLHVPVSLVDLLQRASAIVAS